MSERKMEKRLVTFRVDSPIRVPELIPFQLIVEGLLQRLARFGRTGLPSRTINDLNSDYGVIRIEVSSYLDVYEGTEQSKDVAAIARGERPVFNNWDK